MGKWKPSEEDKVWVIDAVSSGKNHSLAGLCKDWKVARSIPIGYVRLKHHLYKSCEDWGVHKEELPRMMVGSAVRANKSVKSGKRVKEQVSVVKQVDVKEEVALTAVDDFISQLNEIVHKYTLMREENEELRTENAHLRAVLKTSSESLSDALKPMSMLKSVTVNNRGELVSINRNV